jgi:hypothetical protein
MKSKYKVKVHYSGYSTHVVDAENEDEAIVKARGFQVDKNEVLNTLENWKEADTAQIINNGNSRK